MTRLLLLLFALPLVIHAQTISFTFDDGLDPRNEPQAAKFNGAILDALAKHRVEAMFFPAGRNVESEAGLALVRDWSQAGHAIGNHTFSHRSLASNRITLAQFTEDVMVADRMFRDLPRWKPMLRFPYLKEGDTAEKRDGIRTWMRDHGYKPAPVSIDASDWYYSQRYQQLLAKGRSDAAPEMRKAYLAHLKNRALYYEDLAGNVTARSPAHVMLLHTNALNAAFLGDVIDMFRSMGWTIVSPAVAFADPLYSRQPQTLPAGESIVWALAKDAGVKGLRYPAEDAEYEKPIIDALGLLAL